MIERELENALGHDRPVVTLLTQILVDANDPAFAPVGGGVPVVRRADGSHHGIEAVVDKDRASALLSQRLGADVFLLLTDVDAVYRDFGTADARAIETLTAREAQTMDLPAGSMAPKVEAAIAFLRAAGSRAAIGRLEDALGLLNGDQGTQILLQGKAQ